MKLNEVEWEIKLDNKQCVAGAVLLKSDPLLFVGDDYVEKRWKNKMIKLKTGIVHFDADCPFKAAILVVYGTNALNAIMYMIISNGLVNVEKKSTNLPDPNPFHGR